MRAFLLNTPEQDRPVNRDMAGGLGFDRGRSTLLPPLDLLGYATFLNLKGAAVELFDAQAEPADSQAIEQRVRAFAPDAVVMTLSLPTLDEDAALARRIRSQLPSGCRLAIKTGIRHRPILEKILRETACDFCLTGECDLTIDKVLLGEEHGGTVRLCGSEYVDKAERLLVDLDRLPIPDRKLLPNQHYCYPRLELPLTTMQTSRGCPFKCGYYCPYPLVQGEKWRTMSPQRIFDELRHLVVNDGITNVLFRDATFTLKKERVRELCRLIQGQLPVKWWCETRVNCLDIALLNEMQQAGCVGMNVGIETGDEDLLASQAKQGVSVAEIEEMVAHCKRTGLRLHFLLMVGLPGETKRTLYHTYKLVERMKPESIGVTTITPYPGTRFYDDAVRHGWILSEDWRNFGGHQFNAQTGMLTPADLGFALELIHAICPASREEGAAGEARRAELEARFVRWMQE